MWVPIAAPQVQIVDVPVVMRRQNPVIQNVPKTLESLHVQFIDRVVDVPVMTQ